MITFRSPLVPFFVAIAVFARAVQGTFHLDDFALLVDPAITSPSGWLDCFRLTQTRPLTWLTFWANYQMFGEWPGGYLAANVLLHAVNAALVRIAMGRVVPPNVATGAAILFAVHPYAVEPVNYIFARAILLATLFSLLAMRSWFDGKHWAAVGWFAVGMLAKEECAALPLFFLMFEWSTFRCGTRAKLAASTMVGVACLFGARTIWATQMIAGSGSGYGAGFTPLQYLSAQPSVILAYAVNVFVPFQLTIDPDIAIVSGFLGIALWMAVIVSVIYISWRIWAVRNLRAGFWLVGAFVLLLPSSSILPAADFAAFRRMYLPMVLVSVFLADLYSLRVTDDRIKARFLGKVGVLLLAAMSVWQTGFWLSEIALWTRAVQYASHKIRPSVQLARSLPPEEALNVLNDFPKNIPDDGTLASEKARVYLSMQQPALALAEFGKALALSPRDPLAIANRGSALAMLGQTDAAKADFEQALRLDPCQFDARYNLGKVLDYPVAPPPGRCRWNPKQRRQLGLIP